MPADIGIDRSIHASDARIEDADARKNRDERTRRGTRDSARRQASSPISGDKMLSQ
jgi:hypothetical protein